MKKNVNSSKKYAIEVKNYSKNFKKFKAVNNVSFGVKHGKIHGFIGPNGAGKTTTIKAIIGAYHKTHGQIFIEGFLAGSVKAKKTVGYIPERASFPRNMHCMDYLVSMAQLSGMSNKQAHSKALEILSELDLQKHKFRKPSDFSSGMKKKILVAQALMTNPAVLILDEPAANLDPTARKELFTLFKKVVKKGCSILLSSHILSELQDIIDEVTFIAQGQIQYSGSVKDLASENGILASFLDVDSQSVQNFIKKHKMTETIFGWKVKTKTKAEAIKIAKEILNIKLAVSSISFLNANLSDAYYRLVQKFGRESGVNKQHKKLFGFFSKKLSTQKSGVPKVSTKQKGNK